MTSQERQSRLALFSLFVSRYALRGQSENGSSCDLPLAEQPLLNRENSLHSVKVVIVKSGTKCAMKLESVRPHPLRLPRLEQKNRLARTSRALLFSAYPRKNPWPMSVPTRPQCLQA